MHLLRLLFAALTPSDKALYDTCHLSLQVPAPAACPLHYLPPALALGQLAALVPPVQLGQGQRGRNHSWREAIAGGQGWEEAVGEAGCAVCPMLLPKLHTMGLLSLATCSLTHHMSHLSAGQVAAQPWASSQSWSWSVTCPGLVLESEMRLLFFCFFYPWWLGGEVLILDLSKYTICLSSAFWYNLNQDRKLVEVTLVYICAVPGSTERQDTGQKSRFIW